MQVQTYLFGTIEVDPETVITFPDGLSAFENSKRFKLIHEDFGNGEPVSYTLQSLDLPTLAIQIIDPTVLGFQYELELSDEELSKLKVEKAEDVAVMLAVYKRSGQKDIGANIRAPFLINAKSRLGMQKVVPELRPNMMLSNLSSAV